MQFKGKLITKLEKIAKNLIWGQLFARLAEI